MAAHLGGGGERILIAEDDTSYRSYLELRLTQEENITAAVPSAEAALELLDTFRPTILITDLVMSEMDGISLCREVRSRSGWEHLPILVLSGSHDAAAISEVLGLGLIWYLRKGAEWEHFIKTLRNLANRAQAVPL